MGAGLRGSVAGAGERMHAFAGDLFPICRSITGDGVRETLRLVGERIPLEVVEVPSGTPVLDWTVPPEWNVREAYIAAPDGRRVVDFADSNLHLVGYSEPVRAHMELSDLRAHLHTHSERPDWIPWRTSLYSRDWGFCLTQETLDALEEGTYEVVVDSSLEPGSLTWGECRIPGASEEEVLLTTHVCHPSLANDNVSGIALMTELAAVLRASERRLSYRILFIPSTIGSISWLERNADALERVVGGLVVACVGDGGPISYKRSWAGESRVDRAAAYVVGATPGGRVLPFVPWGWDERQFNTPGFRLPVGSLSRSREGEYAEYHSSADDLELIRPEYLEESLGVLASILDTLERDAVYVNLAPRGEPNLGRRGLYKAVGGGAAEADQLSLLWVLNQSDGTCSLVDIAERCGYDFARIRTAADMLLEAGLLDELPPAEGK